MLLNELFIKQALVLNVKIHGYVLSPGFIITDFETAAINALRQVFQASVLDGYFFSSDPHVFRQVKRTGLQAQYMNVPSSQAWCASCVPSFLSPHQIRQVCVIVPRDTAI